MPDNIEIASSPSVAAPIPRQTTADDLLEMYAQEDQVKSDEVNVEVEKQARVAEELPKKIVANKLVKNLENKSEAESVLNGEENGNQEADEKASEENQEAGKEEVKAFKAKLGDSEVDIPEEATITQKIGNKDVSFKVADAVKAFVGQETFNRNMDRRVQAVTSKETKLRSEYEQIKTKAGNLTQLAKRGEWVPVIKSLAKMAAGNSDLDVVELEKQCLESLENIRKLYSDMTPEQRELYYANRRAEAAKEEAKTLREQNQHKEAVAQIEREIDQLCTANALEKDRFYKLFETLSQNNVGDGKKFSSADEIEPKHVLEFHQDIQHLGKVQDAVSRVNEALIDDDDFCREMFELTRSHQEFTVEDLESIIRDALSTNSQSIENLNRKVQQANSQNLRTQLSQGGSKGQTSEIDEELEEDFLRTSKRERQLAHLMRR